MFERVFEFFNRNNYLLNDFSYLLYNYKYFSTGFYDIYCDIRALISIKLLLPFE
jgi:hypothetical protein